MLLIQFFNGETKNVPDTLMFRAETYTMLLIGIVALAFTFLALSRMSNGRSIQTVLGVFFKGASTEQILKENMRLNSFSSILLFFNFLICVSLCLFILFNRVLLVSGYLSFIFSLGISLVIFFLETIGLYLVGWITGEQKNLNNTIIHTLTGYQFTGLLLAVLSLFWIMNPEYNRIFLGLFISIMCLKIVTRLLKNSVSVLSSGVSWYYLILYFCTLEILPLFVAYYYVSKNFLK